MEAQQHSNNELQRNRCSTQMPLIYSPYALSLSVGHTSLEPHSHEVMINSMANWNLENLPRNNRKENRNYNLEVNLD
jgi:hypothetical protein